MLKFLKYLVLGLIAIALVVLGVANIDPVTLRLLPPGIVEQTYAIEGVPLSIVIFLAILLGVIIGELFEWLREHKHRKTAKNRAAEIEELKAENARLRKKLDDPREDLPRIAAQ